MNFAFGETERQNKKSVNTHRCGWFELNCHRLDYFELLFVSIPTSKKIAVQRQMESKSLSLSHFWKPMALFFFNVKRQKWYWLV